ncbi:MAG: hypothetical protein J0M16_09675, partial [Gammaproteobacteria bacterium]|nr:hypothetical protein [Gammaproteobacteria bacterium]
ESELTAISAGDGKDVRANGRALAGSAGSASSGSTVGAQGGTARSSSTGTALGNSSVLVRDEATGGTGTGSYGGGARSTAVGTTSGSATVTVSSTARGGMGGTRGSVGAPEHSTATATGSGGGSVDAYASHTGPGGGSGGSSDATAVTRPGNGGPGAVTARALATGQAGATEARTSAGQAMSMDPLFGPQVTYAWGTLAPGDGYASLALSGSEARERVSANFDVGGRSDILGLAMLGGVSGAVYSSSVDFELHLDQLDDPQRLLVGLLGSSWSESEFTNPNVRFRIAVNGVTAVDETFLDLATAIAFFDGRTLDLGDVSLLATAPSQHVEFMIDGTAFYSPKLLGLSLILGNASPVPAPPALALLLTGIGLLAARSGYRRAGST